MMELDDLLQRVLTGELSPDDAAVRARRDADPDFARELDESLALQDLLDEDAADEREALEAPTAPRRWPMWLIAMAAGLLAVVFVPRLSPPKAPDGGQGVMLGGSLELEGLRPAGPGRSFRTFGFDATLPDGARCEIRVWAVDAGEGTPAVLTGRFTGNEWSPSDDERRSLPDEIRWELRVFDVAGSAIGFGRVDSASR